MGELYYRDALKRGQRAYHARVSAGQYPYLPVLEEMLPPGAADSGQDLGLLSIPCEYIVGTKTRGRTNAFAVNFMPLLPDSTEFAQKWEALCQAHVSEGIRDPVKVYEYLNRYYVQEGNKRVSVLKFFDAVTIPAEVIRVLPADSDAPEVQCYLELVAFSRLSGINYVELSKRGAYERLQTLVGKGQGERWTETERSRFSAAYYAFRQAYQAAGGDRLSASPADAMLSYLEIYGYGHLLSAGQRELRQEIAGMWEEVRLQREKTPVELKTEPEAEKREGLLQKALSGLKTLRVAFVYDRNPDNSPWAYAHEQGRLHLQEVFGGRAETACYSDAMEKGDRQVIEQAIAEGNRLLFTTSPRLLQASLQAAIEHPEVTIFNCALNQSHRYIRTYYPRIYEAKFIAGAIAGIMAGEENIGYICDYPIYGQIAGINAFALGAQMVNPRTRIYLEWTSVEGEEEARRKLTERNIHLISLQDMSGGRKDSEGSYGLIETDGHTSRLLAAPVWKWEMYYEGMLRRILDRTLQAEYEDSTKALNYYWGMAAGAVDIRLSDQLPAGAAKLARCLKQGICDQTLNPFALPVIKQSGEAALSEGDALEMEEIMEMDYLTENIIGAIPDYGEIRKDSKVTVQVMGVELPGRK